MNTFRNKYLPYPTYWSSTEDASADACTRYFFNGRTYYENKPDINLVRATRKVKKHNSKTSPCNAS